MINREELIKSKEYWITKIQISLFNEIEEYIKTKGITKTQFADEMGVSKGYISQVLNGNFDHKLSKFVELCLAIGKIPKIEFEDILRFQLEDAISSEHQISNKLIDNLSTIDARRISSSGISYEIRVAGENSWFYENDKYSNEKSVEFIVEEGIDLTTMLKNTISNR